MRIFVDTNILVCLFDADEPHKRERAHQVIEELARAKSLVLSSQVLSELYVTVTRKLGVPLSPADALRAVDDLATYPVVAVDANLVRRAAARSAAEQLSYWDALIVEAAIEAAADALYTEDLQPGRAYGGVRVENPFAA